MSEHFGLSQVVASVRLVLTTTLEANMNTIGRQQQKRDLKVKIYSFINQSIYVSVCPSVHPPIHLSLSLYLSQRLNFPSSLSSLFRLILGVDGEIGTAGHTLLCEIVSLLVYDGSSP